MPYCFCFGFFTAKNQLVGLTRRSFGQICPTLVLEYLNGTPAYSAKMAH
uniref:Uncharacterized protein n=3 Tax=Aegilops tauschii subsp. strangulata TaxID=200361 RepID=A0A453AJ49_AEGTS